MDQLEQLILFLKPNSHLLETFFPLQCGCSDQISAPGYADVFGRTQDGASFFSTEGIAQLAGVMKGVLFEMYRVKSVSHALHFQ